MKRADIEVGKEYFASTRNSDWQTASLDYFKVTVLSAEPAELAGFRRDRIVSVGSGSGVHVRGSRYSRDRETVIPLSQIRGPWAETLAMVEANVEAARKARDERAQRKDDAADYARGVLERFRAATGARSYDVHVDTGRWDSSTDRDRIKVEIRASHLEALLNRIDELEVAASLPCDHPADA